MITKCDACGRDSAVLSDYFALLCPECRERHTDIILLKRLGQALERLHSTEVLP
jgi:Zn finger protein HypA/HybF involved in hydrogenase expression